MILETFKYITSVIDEKFPVNGYAITQNGKIRWANTRLLELSQVSNLKAIKGKHVSIFGEKDWLATKEIIESKRSQALYESVDDKDYISFKIPCSQGGFHGVFGMSIDITKLNQAELAKQEFLLSMGHDIRTPFTAIIGLLGLLYANEVNPEKKEWVDGILHSCEWVLSFMNDIQEIVELGYLPLNYKTCDIQAIIEDIVLFSKASATLKKLTIETHCEAAKVLIDSFRLNKILLNLLDNAIKFTPKGSIKVAAVQAASNLILRVSDEGVGIDKPYQEKIFEKCFQVVPCYKKTGYSGIGKGLYIVKKYVEELQGKISVKSELNKGSTFIVEIPLNLEQIVA